MHFFGVRRADFAIVVFLVFLESLHKTMVSEIGLVIYKISATTSIGDQHTSYSTHRQANTLCPTLCVYTRRSRVITRIVIHAFIDIDAHTDFVFFVASLATAVESESARKKKKNVCIGL